MLNIIYLIIYNLNNFYKLLLNLRCFFINNYNTFSIIKKYLSSYICKGRIYYYKNKKFIFAFSFLLSIHFQKIS